MCYLGFDQRDYDIDCVMDDMACKVIAEMMSNKVLSYDFSVTVLFFCIIPVIKWKDAGPLTCNGTQKDVKKCRYVSGYPTKVISSTNLS